MTKRKPVQKQRAVTVNERVAKIVGGGTVFAKVSLDDFYPDKKPKFHKKPTLGDVWKKANEDLGNLIRGKMIKRRKK